MVLVSLVQEVVGGDIEFCNFLALYLDICACRKTEQGIAGRRCLGIIGAVDVRLFQIAVETSGDVEIIECDSALGMGMTVLVHGVWTDRTMRMMEQFPLQLRCPFGSRRKREILCVGCCIQQLSIYIREGVGEMDTMDGMEVDTSLKAQQSGIALGIDVGEVTFFHFLSHTSANCAET